MSNQPKTTPHEEALWGAYWADRSDAHRNAIFEFHWPWMQAATSKRLRVFRAMELRDEVLSDVATAALAAITRHDAALGNFRSYATARIRSVIHQALRNGKPDTAIPKVRTALSQSLGHRPTDAEVAGHLGIPESEVIAADQPEDVQAEWHWNNDGEIPKPPHPQPHAKKESNYSDTFAHLTRGLLPRERKVLWLQYIDGLTQEETAAHFGKSQSQIYRETRVALKFLQQNRTFNDGISDY